VPTNNETSDRARLVWVAVAASGVLCGISTSIDGVRAEDNEGSLPFQKSQKMF
jgi:hypothetical protein